VVTRSARRLSKKMHIEPSFPEQLRSRKLGPELTSNGQIYIGHGRYMVTYPIENGHFMNMVAIARKPEFTWDKDGPWQISAVREDMLKDFEGWYHPLVDLRSRNVNLQK